MTGETTMQEVPERSSVWLYKGLRVIVDDVRVAWHYEEIPIGASRSQFEASFSAWTESFTPAPFIPEVGKAYAHVSETYANFHVYEVKGKTVFGRAQNYRQGTWFPYSVDLDSFPSHYKQQPQPEQVDAEEAE